MLNIIMQACLGLLLLCASYVGVRILYKKFKYRNIEFELEGTTKKERKAEALASIRHGLRLLKVNRCLP